MKGYSNEELIFGLDIGTRTVVGIVGYKENNKFVILDYESIEHEERAMSDGQIHDIQKVSRAVYEVKNILERRLNIELTDVAIAAAGRTLNTQIVSVENVYDEIQEFTLTDVHNLELHGIEKAKEQQKKITSEGDYYCVAYSVIHYYLDGYMITNLEGHKGTAIGAKMIATFLPKLVIDSLYAVTERSGLSVSHLTLEPIAAINAVIPENIRLLNLALVDIGAGTSDIAITKDGSVIAYGMIPVAGDEVTEAIVHKYLVDFNTAEKIKQRITVSDTMEFEDILGLTQKVSSKEVSEVIQGTINMLTEQIAQKILELNGGSAPNAVFCVGGGSQMFSVTECLAKVLHVPEQRVAVRTAENVVNVTDQAGIINGPEMITPLGICITSMQSKYSQFTTITLNNQKVQLLNAKKLTVLDAIIAAGIEHTDVFPKKGKTLMFKLNGERIRIKGENGSPAVITLNGKEAGIQDRIAEGDIITLTLGRHGQDAHALVSEYVTESMDITIDGVKYTLPIMRNENRPISADYSIKEGDNIQISYPENLAELLGDLQITYQNQMILVNFNKAELHYKLQNGDSILINSVSHRTDDLSDGLGETLAQEEINHLESQKAHDIFVTVNGDVVRLPAKDTPYMLASIFDNITFDLSKPQGTIQLVKNGLPAALTDNLHDKDRLEIYWKK